MLDKPRRSPIHSKDISKIQLILKNLKTYRIFFQIDKSMT